MTRSPVEHLAAALDEAARLVDGVGADRWELPTPCAPWSVRDVVEHVTNGNRSLAGALLGSDASPPPGEAAAFRGAATALLAGFAADGVLERLVTVPFGRVPGLVALQLRLVEAVVHGWDIAAATDQALDVDGEVTQRALEFTRTTLSELPAGRRPFGPARPVPAGAPALDQLVALLGRDLVQPNG